MATKKTATTTKKRTVKKAAPVAKTSTKVTTVKANAGAAARTSRSRFTFSRAPLLSASVAEFVGTFMLAGVILAASNQPLFVLFGLIGIVLTVGGLSGAHLNPALTIGALATKRINLVRALCYVVAQVLGALLALVIMSSFISAAPAVNEQAAQLGQSAPTLFTAAAIPEGKEWIVLAAELLGSVILALGVAAALRLGRGNASHALGYAGALYVAILIGGTVANYVGASAIMNPAVAGALQGLKFELWPLMIYVLTPIVGAVLGFALSDLLHAENETVTVE